MPEVESEGELEIDEGCWFEIGRGIGGETVRLRMDKAGAESGGRETTMSDERGRKKKKGCARCSM